MDAHTTHTEKLAARCRAIAADLESRGVTTPIENLIRRVLRPIEHGSGNR